MRSASIRFDSRGKKILCIAHIFPWFWQRWMLAQHFHIYHFFLLFPPFIFADEAEFSRIFLNFIRCIIISGMNTDTLEKNRFFLWIKDPISFIIMTAGTTSCCSLFVTSNGFELLINGERFVRIVDCHLIVLIHQYVSVEFLLLNSIFHCDLLFFHTLCIVGLTNRNCVSNRLKIS